jgi:CarD family transcriptional regulator
MASVKKTTKSSKTKQAKQPGTSKAQASKRSSKLKVKRGTDTRVLAVKKPAASRSGRKTRARTKSAASTRANPRVAAKPAERKSASLSRTSVTASRSTAKKGATARTTKPALARAAAAERRPTKSVSGKIAKKTAASKPKTKTPAIAPRRRVTSKPAAAPKVVPSPIQAAQKPAAREAIAVINKDAPSLSEAGRQAALRPPSPAAGKSSNIELVSKEQTAVVKKADKQMSTGLADGSAAAGRAPALANGAPAPTPPLPATKSADTSLAAKAKGATTPPPSHNQAGTAGVAAAAACAAGQTAETEIKPAARVTTPAHKPAKSASPQRQSFKMNEFVVYPAHGVGQIIAIEEQEVAGFKLELYVISFVRDKMILKVPTAKAATVGMRKLADAGAVKVALNTLAGRARIKRTMWSRRAQEYEAKINSGDLNAIAEVVRDLYRSETQPEQSYSERQLYEAALDRMAREIVVVQNLTETESLKVIEAQLQQGPRRKKSEESQAEETEAEETMVEETDIEEAA